MCKCNCDCKCAPIVQCNHCWHPSHTGPWWGINPPPTICCRCGISYGETHGPYLPHYSTGTTIKLDADNKLKIYGNDTGNGAKFRFDVLLNNQAETVCTCNGINTGCSHPNCKSKQK